MNLSNKIKVLANHIVEIGIVVIIFLIKISDFSNYINEKWNNILSNILIVGFLIIGIGILIGIFSEFLEENKTLKGLYISNFIKEIGILLGLVVFVIGILFVSIECYYYFYKTELFSLSKIILFLFILFFGWFLMKRSYYSIIDLDLIKFAISNLKNLGIDIEVSKSGGIIPKKEVNLRTKINDTIFNIRKKKNGYVEIVALLSFKLNLDVEISLSENVESVGIKEDDFILKPYDEIKEIFSALNKEYGENFLFLKEKGFKSIKNISPDRICATIVYEDYEKKLYDFLMQFSRFIELIKNSNLSCLKKSF